MKRFTKSSSQRLSMHYKKGVPAKINKGFLTRKVDAAFISSINSRRFRNVNLGIVARDDVQSVLVIPNNGYKKDKASATSNVLAKLLDINGEVIIGDNALRYFLSGGEHIDLAYEWKKRFNLPFVFAVLCYHKDKKLYKRIENRFSRQKVKIPSYILQNAARKSSIKEREILEYLKHISYKLDPKAQAGLKLFLKKSFYEKR